MSKDKTLLTDKLITMLYGRRILDNKSPKNHIKRRRLILHKSFQYKYTGLLVFGLSAALFIFSLPTLYFINQNYDLFARLAYNEQPEMIDYLRREAFAMNMFLLISTVSLVAFTLYLGLRLTGKVVGPLIALERHMKKVIHGDLTLPQLQTRVDDELKDLVKIYEHLYLSIRTQAENDLMMIQKLHINPNDHESFNIWKNYVEYKKHQLGIQNIKSTSNDSSSSTDQAEPSRRVS